MNTLSFVLIMSMATAATAVPLKLALNWKAEPQFGGFYAAQAAGFFKKNGLQIEIIEGGSGTPTIQMLTAGQVDYAVVSADEIVVAHERGATQVVAIYASYQTNPQGFIVHENSQVADIPSLLKRKDIILLWQAGLPYALYLKKKFGPLSVATAPYQGGLGAFQANTRIAQQCFVTSEPLLAKKMGIPVKTFLISEVGYNPYTTVLATTWDRIKNHPEEVKKVRAAVQEGWAFYLKTPDKINQNMAKINKAMDLETFRQSALAQHDLVETSETKKSGLGSMTKERWQILTAQLSAIGLVKKAPPVEKLYLNGETH